MMNSNDLPIEWIERIFMRLHGRFGNQFYDKFRIGQLNEKGEDIGIENAKQTWSSDLAGISSDGIAIAIKEVYLYPPSCDEFKKACISAILRKQTDFLSLPKPAVNNEILQAGLAKMNEIVKSNPRTDKYTSWIFRILDNPKNYPDHSFKLAMQAKEKLGL